MSKQDASRKDELQALLELTGGRPGVPADREQRVRDHIRGEWQAQVAVRRRRRRQLVGGMLAAAATIAAVALLAIRGTVPPELARVDRVHADTTATAAVTLAAGTALRQGRTLETPRGVRLALSLRSGHAIRLDQQSRLELAGPSTLILDRGTIYVASAEGGYDDVEPRPIVIETPHGSVHEVGTRYEVRVDDGDAELSVRVRQGVVELRRSRVETVRVAASERADLRDGEVVRDAIRDHDPAWGWVWRVAEPISLDGRTLSDFLQWSAAELSLRTVYADPALAAEARAIELSGSIEGMSLDEAIRSVLTTCNLEHRIEGSELIVRSKDRSASS